MAKKADGTEDETQVDPIQYVTMVRDEKVHPAPHTAQVHPDEVQNYYSGGWTPAKEAE